MSAIAGIVNFDRAPVDEGLLRRMDVEARGRGPDTHGWWTNDGVGFVYRGVRDSAEADLSQPVVDGETGVVVLLDGHVHGRRQLSAGCAAAGHPPRRDTDSELILRSYRAWGEACASRIVGEYAFVVWDPRCRRLLCARDAAGVRPLFYAVGRNGSFTFATGANQLLANPALARSLDPEGAVAFLMGDQLAAGDRTPCSSIRHVPAAHILLVDHRGAVAQSHWSEDDIEADPSHGADEIDAVTEAMLCAIRDRLERVAAVGISLSGGWDSGTIFSLWQWMRGCGEPLPVPWVHTHYSKYPEADEREEVRRLLDRWPAEASFTAVDENPLLDGLAQHVRELGMPEPAFGWPVLQSQGRLARARGVHTFLTGEGGNFVCESSMLRSADLLLAGQLRATQRQLTIVAGELGCSPREILWSCLVRPALSASWPGLRRLRRVLRSRAPHPCLGGSFRRIARELADRTAATDRELRRFGPAVFDKRRRLRQLRQSLFPIPAAADLSGVMLTAPFLDRRVMEVGQRALAREALPTPSRQLLGTVLRRTVGHALPGRYAHITRWVTDALRCGVMAKDPLFAAGTLIEFDVLDGGRVRAFLADFLARPALNWFWLWRLVSLEAWAEVWLANVPVPSENSISRRGNERVTGRERRR